MLYEAAHNFYVYHDKVNLKSEKQPITWLLVMMLIKKQQQKNRFF